MKRDHWRTNAMLVFEQGHRSLAGGATGQDSRFGQDLKAIADAQQWSPGGQKVRQLVPQLGHQHRGENPSGSEVVAVREAARDHGRLVTVQAGSRFEQIAEQDEFRAPASELDRGGRLFVAIGTWRVQDRCRGLRHSTTSRKVWLQPSASDETWSCHRTASPSARISRGSAITSPIRVQGARPDRRSSPRP